MCLGTITKTIDYLATDKTMTGEQLIELIEIDGWKHLGLNYKTFHNQQGIGTPDKIMGY